MSFTLEFRHRIPKFLTVHTHLTGFSDIACRGFRSWFNLSNNSPRALCKRERTVPMGQLNATAASA
jgi:hypothetical protein